MGTVKDLIIIKEPTKTKMGLGDFWFKEFPDADGIEGGTFSVKDYGIMPTEKKPDLIPAKGQVLCIVGALLFEYLRKRGIDSHYLGVVGPNGEVVRVNQLTEPTNRMRICVSRVIPPKFDPSLPSRYDYSFFTEGQGKIDNYVVPIECIYRNALPYGSSKRKKIVEAYEREDMDSVNEQLEELGLTLDSLEKILGKETVWLPRPYKEFTTKYEQDDRDLGTAKKDSAAFEISGMTRDKFESSKKLIDDGNEATSRFYELVGLINGIEIGHLDGKGEIVLSGYPLFGDVFGTLDEIRADVDGFQVSKEPVRQWYDTFKPEWSAAVKAAKKEARDRALPEWTDLVKVATPRLPDEYRRLMGEMYQAFGNLVTYAVLKQDWWPTARPIGEVLKDVHSYLEG